MRLLATLLCLALLATAAHADSGIIKKKVAASFDDTRDAITLAIEGRGLVINYVSHIGDMLDRTGADIGATRQVYAKAEIIEFCSAGLSRQMMELDPHNIVLCPFAIAVSPCPARRRQPGYPTASQGVRRPSWCSHCCRQLLTKPVSKAKTGRLRQAAGLQQPAAPSQFSRAP